MRVRDPLLQAVTVGATAGVLSQVLVMRLNPEVYASPSSLIAGAPLWATWGAAMLGLPLAVVLIIGRRLRPRSETRGHWTLPTLVVTVYLVAAVLSRLNADLHPEYLSGTGHRILRQDAVAWLVAAVVCGGAATLIHRLGRTRELATVYGILVLVLPLLRLVGQPTPQGQPEVVESRALGKPSAPLVVCGLEGLDSKVLLTYAAGDRYPALDRLQREGAWGPFRPFRPYLQRAHWTTVATGTLPRRNGVKARWGWRMPLLFDETLRLLPWTPQGSRLMLPWGLAERVTPPPSTVPPLWQRVRAASVTTEVLDWPGLWSAGAGVEEVRGGARVELEANFSSSLAVALDPFGERGLLVEEAVLTDLARVEISIQASREGCTNLWLHMGSLDAARRHLEPLHPVDTSKREVLNLVLEFVDSQLARLMEEAGPQGLVVVLSPYGLSPPDPLERIRRLLGAGGNWQTSAESCPDGLLLISGRGVAAGSRFTSAELIDLAPTVCYLLGLPVAQYMGGRVVSEAVQPDFLAAHPLRVVD